MPTAEVVDLKRRLSHPDPFAWLIECRVNADEAIRITPYDEQLTFGGDIYYPYPCTFDGLDVSTDGTNPTLKLVIPNADEQISAYLEENSGLTGRVVMVRLVHVDLLSQAAIIEQRYEIESTELSRLAITFTLGPLYAFTQRLPHERFLRWRCRFTFGSEECGYDDTREGALQDCDQTIDGKMGCTMHGDDEDANGLPRTHPKFFGGFPSILRPRQ